MKTEFDEIKVTIYTRSEFFGNIVKREAYLKEIKIGKWAQYGKAVYTTMKIKHKRGFQTNVQSYNPYIVIVEGWNRPDPKDMFDVIEQRENVTVKKSSYSSFDDRFSTDFDSLVDSGKIGTVIFEARYTKGYSSY
jgi:hypothetical protein